MSNKLRWIDICGGGTCHVTFARRKQGGGLRLGRYTITSASSRARLQRVINSHPHSVITHEWGLGVSLDINKE